LKILDVGCGMVGIASYLRGWRVVGVDPEMTGSAWCRSPVLAASAAALPFADRSWDVVTCVDVLEHIEPPLRVAVMEELIRVSRRWVLVAFPSGHEARQADLRAETAYREAGIAPPAWLSEHVRHPLPDPDELANALPSSPAGLRVTERWTYYNESLVLQRAHRYLARRAPMVYRLFTVACSLAVPLLARPRPSTRSYRCLMVLQLSADLGGAGGPSSTIAAARGHGRS
jgi:hypothetical protein